MNHLAVLRLGESFAVEIQASLADDMTYYALC